MAQSTTRTETGSYSLLSTRPGPTVARFSSAMRDNSKLFCVLTTRLDPDHEDAKSEEQGDL